MCAINLYTKRLLTNDELKMIEKKFGFEAILDYDDDFSGEQQSYANYFIGRDYDQESDEEPDGIEHHEELYFSYEDAWEAEEWFKQFEWINKTSVTPYQGW